MTFLYCATIICQLRGELLRWLSEDEHSFSVFLIEKTPFSRDVDAGLAHRLRSHLLRSKSFRPSCLCLCWHLYSGYLMLMTLLAYWNQKIRLPQLYLHNNSGENEPRL